jgi:vaccinia related kinase
MLEKIIVIDENNNKWFIKNKIAQGGFGTIHNAEGNASLGSTQNDVREKFIAKIEPSDENHLETEEKIYRTLMLSKQASTHIPTLYASGIGMNKYKEHFRYIILEHLDVDLSSFLKTHLGKDESWCIVDQIVTQLISALHFCHNHGCSHGDIKPHNILVNLNDGAPIFKLADFGLSQLFIKNDKHVSYQTGQLRLHRGTLSFISEDSHLGVLPSRRSDLENLGWMLILSLFKISLPWYLNDKSYEQRDKSAVLREKQIFKKQLWKLPSVLQKFMTLVCNLNYDEAPDYDSLWNAS